MKNLNRLWIAALAMAIALFAAACGGGEEAAEPADETEATESAEEMTESSESEMTEGSEEEMTSESEGDMAALDTSCQVELPADGEGSADGMADDPVATAASNNPALSTLVMAVTQVGLVDTLNDTSQEYTVFAPVNDAFAAIPEADLNAVLADDELLTSILTLHVVPGEQMDAEARASAGTVETVNGQEITLTAEDGTLQVNGQASVICPNVMTANATVHLIDTVLMPEG